MKGRARSVRVIDGRLNLAACEGARTAATF